MASSVFIKQQILALIMLFIVVLGFRLGRAEIGIAGTGMGYLPEPGGGAEEEGGHGYLPEPGDGAEEEGGHGYLPEPGGGAEEEGGHGSEPEGGEHEGGEPEGVVTKALLCFSDKHIYSSCEESYRLTKSGELHVPPEYTDEYCHGPCLKETHLVLDCVDDILSAFVFYNHATIKDVKKTIKTGCSYGPERGNFNVAEHIGDESSSYKNSYPCLFGLASIFLIVFNLLF